MISLDTQERRLLFAYPSGMGSRRGMFSTSHMMAGAAFFPSAHASAVCCAAASDIIIIFEETVSSLLVEETISRRRSAARDDNERNAKAQPMDCNHGRQQPPTTR